MQREQKMILDNGLVYDAIVKKRPLSKLFNSNVEELLDDYVVQDYVTSENIPDVEINGHPGKTPVSVFYEKYRYLMEAEINDALKRYGYESAYARQVHFPYKFKVHLFDTFLAVVITLRDSNNTEFLVLSPQQPPGDDPLAEALSGMTAALTLIPLFKAVSEDPGARVALYIKVGQLLDYLHTGKRKKKRFGIF
jgi:hypothetical protein